MKKKTIQISESDFEWLSKLMNERCIDFHDVTETLETVLIEAASDNGDATEYELSQTPDHPRNKTFIDNLIKVRDEKRELIDSLK
jgi:hypothetical protein